MELHLKGDGKGIEAGDVRDGDGHRMSARRGCPASGSFDQDVDSTVGRNSITVTDRFGRSISFLPLFLYFSRLLVGSLSLKRNIFFFFFFKARGLQLISKGIDTRPCPLRKKFSEMLSSGRISGPGTDIVRVECPMLHSRTESSNLMEIAGLL